MTQQEKLDHDKINPKIKNTVSKNDLISIKNMRINVLYISKNRMNWELWYSQYKSEITYTGSNTDKNNSCEKTTASIIYWCLANYCLMFGKLFLMPPLFLMPMP